MPKPFIQTKFFVNPVEDAAQIIDEYEGFIRWIISSQNTFNLSEDDLFQDFYLLLISKPIPTNVKNIRGYLYKAVLNHLADSCSKFHFYEKNVKKIEKNNIFRINKIDPEGALLIKEETNRMFELIKERSPGQKYVAITLRYRDGYSIQEIADKMGLKYSSVARYISKGLGIIRQCLNNT